MMCNYSRSRQKKSTLETPVLIKSTWDCTNAYHTKKISKLGTKVLNNKHVWVSGKKGKGSPNEDSILTVLCKYTSDHMENRRCQHLPQPNGQPGEAPAQSSECESPLLIGATSLISLTQTEELFDLIASSQSRRLDDQRASVGDLLGITITQNNIGHYCEACTPQDLSDDFFNMLIKYQSSRINDQRCSLPPVPDPDEDFFSLIQRVQAKRMDEQRVSFYSDENDATDSEPKPKPTS